MPKIKDVALHLESLAPLSLQESYDNSGLLVGDMSREVTGILISLDCTEDVVNEAISKDCNMVISHHPIIFGGLKRLTGNSYVERTVELAIKNDVAIYAIHTNLDNIKSGVNAKVCEVLGLKPLRILAPKSDLMKIVTFIPPKDIQEVTGAMFHAGAGEIGDYSNCSFQVEGVGTFKPGDSAEPHLGEKGNDENVDEIRVEMIFPSSHVSTVVKALTESHPYEEVAYYLNTLSNQNPDHGAGLLAECTEDLSFEEFLDRLKQKMNLKVIRHTGILEGKVKTVAICGGSGSFLIKDAIRAGADVFVTADVKYHDFFDADGKMMIADIGHYESEVFTKDLLHDILCEKFTTFAVNLSETVTNPISYFLKIHGKPSSSPEAREPS